MAATIPEFLIIGLTSNGKPFRPSDWAERLAGVMAVFGGDPSDGRMAYSPYVYPITSAGVKCVVVDIRLQDIEPLAHQFLTDFVTDNDLQTRPGRGKARPDQPNAA
jgi:hypothetical protein